VGDDDDTIHSEEGAATVGFVVGAVLDSLKGPLAKEGSGDADRVLFEFFLHPLGHRFCGGLAAFENDVPGKSVAEADVELGLEKVVAFDISAKGERCVALLDEVLEENQGLLGEGGAFFFFLTIGHDAYFGVGTFEDFAGVNAAHDGVVEKVTGLCFGIGSGVEEVADAEFVWHGGGDAGSLHPFEEAEFHGRGCDGCSGVAGRNEGLGFSIFDKVGRDRDGGLLFAPEGFGSGFLHADDFGGLDEDGARVGESAFGGRFPQLVGGTGEEDGFDPGVFGENVARSFEVDSGGVVAAHGIKCNLHHGKKARRVPPRSVKFWEMCPVTRSKRDRRRPPDDRGMFRKMGRRCVRGHWSRTQDKS